MTATVTIDVAGGAAGGAARFRDELYRYLARSGRDDINVIGAQHAVDPAWLLRREARRSRSARMVATNCVGFVAGGGERWTLLRNALHFLSDDEEARLDPALRLANRRKAHLVRLAARRSDVLVAPSTAMAERAVRVMPSLRNRMVVRMHPVSSDLIPGVPREQFVLCPVLFGSYKDTAERIRELAVTIDRIGVPSMQVIVTADAAEVPPALAAHPRVRLAGQLKHADLCGLWARSRAIYFPSALESFGYPLAEARVSGHPVIACDTIQNREIAGPALCGYTPRDDRSLLRATSLALAAKITPDPGPFDPDAYFDWLLAS
jgi:hypothetical protein